MHGRRFAFLLIATILAPLVVACGGPAGEAQKPTEADVDLKGPIELTLWHGQAGDQIKALEEMAADFSKTNEFGISVKVVAQGSGTQLYQKMLAAIQAGSLPDLAAAQESQVADYQKGNVVIDLDPYVNSAKNGLSKEARDDIYKPYFDINRYARYDNKLLSFPFAKSLQIMYVNDDLLKAAGATSYKTWEDFEKAARAAKKVSPDGKTTQWGWAFTTSASEFHSWVLSRGGKLISDDNKTVAWDSKEGLESLKLAQRSLNEGWAFLAKGFEHQNVFGDGKLAFVISTSTGRPFFRAAMKTPINWSIGSVPQSNPQSPKTVMFGPNIAIFKSTPEKQLAAWQFVKWFTEAPQTARWSVASAYMPVRKSAANEAVLQDAWRSNDPQGKQSFDLIPSSITEPNVPGSQEVRNVVEDMMGKVLNNKATPEDALKEAATKANAILKEKQ